MTNFNILSACPGQAEVIGIWHQLVLKSVCVRSALNIRFAVSSRTDLGSRRILAIHWAKVL